jgi:hypothetical protein
LIEHLKDVRESIIERLHADDSAAEGKEASAHSQRFMAPGALVGVCYTLSRTPTQRVWVKEGTDARREI